MINTIFPIYFLIFSGFLAKKKNIFKDGDQKVLNSYVYYFSLPLLFFVELSRLEFTNKLLFISVISVIPLFLLMAIFKVLTRINKIKRENVYLFFICISFGSTALFGIPFITFSYPGNENAGTLSALFAGVIGLVGLVFVIYFFESLKHKNRLKNNRLKITLRFLKNPLIISIIAGFLYVILELKLPALIIDTFLMAGKTTTPVALFMLGVFLGSKKYYFSKFVFFISFFKVALLPLMILFYLKFFNINKIENDIITLMYATPGALALLVLSERYGLFVKQIAAFILITSLSAPFLMKLWVNFV